MDQTFARSYRLTKTDEYSSVFGFRRAIRGQWLMLHYQPRPNGEASARLGIVVAKKLLKRAVDRNRFKRVLRDQFRRTRASLPACDLVVRLHVKAPPLADASLARELVHLMQKLPRKPVQQSTQ